MENLMPVERIENRIFLIRGQKVMLDIHLAQLYGVETKKLNQAVRRNKDRFPEDFMFSLSKQEIFLLSKSMVPDSRSQFVTLKQGKNIKYAPYAFTENGVAMLSSVLRSKQAIAVNIQIMRAFTRLRKILAGHKELAIKIEELERKHSKHEIEITTIFKVLKKLMEPKPEPPAKRIGFV
ncbi:MAG: ORF6N domain-containing protein [Candidatus Margulisiibacteriota bacterium]